MGVYVCVGVGVCVCESERKMTYFMLMHKLWRVFTEKEEAVLSSYCVVYFEGT